MKKLLVLKDNYFDDHILLCFKSLMEELCKFNEVSKKEYNIEIESATIEDDFSYLRDCDWVLVFSFYPKHYTFFRERGTKIIVFWDDIHYHTQKDFQLRIEMFSQADIILLPYYKQFLKREEYKKFWDKAIFFPWYAPDECFEFIKSIKERKDQVLLSGRMSDPYELRKMIYNYYKEDKFFYYLEHPGYDRSNRKHNIIRRSYYDFVSNYKLAIVTTATIPLNYTVAKYFEIPACGCVPILEPTEDFTELYFKENVNFIKIDRNNFKEIKNIIRELDIEKIGENAFNLMKTRHTVRSRINYLLGLLRTI